MLSTQAAPISAPFPSANAMVRVYKGVSVPVVVAGISRPVPTGRAAGWKQPMGETNSYSKTARPYLENE